MKLHKHIWQTALVAVALASGSSAIGADRDRDVDSKQNRGQLSEKDFRFAINAARGGMTETRLGEIAKQKAGSQQVKDFGQRMVTDHSKANDELKQIIANKGAVLPAELSHHENSEIDKFDKLTGRDFDKEYAEYMVKDHKKDLKEFQDAAKDLSDPDLKAFAQKTAGVIEEHLRMAKDIQTAVK